MGAAIPLLVEALSAPALSADEAWWAIYAQAFPAREREPRQVIIRSLERGVGMAFRARRGATTVGLASAHLLKSVPAVFLVYVATAPEARGTGAGRALVDRTWQRGAAALQAQHLDAGGLIWEIEDPDGAVGDLLRAERQARLRFFQGLGGQLLARPYMQPPVDGVAPVPMRLMYRPAPGTPIPADASIDDLVRAIYFEKYGELNGIPSQVLSNLLDNAP